MSALTLPVAERIRGLHAAGEPLPAIAAATGIRVRMVNEVVRGRRDGRPLTAREQADEDERTGWAPRCLTPLEWADWRVLNPLAIAQAVGRPCDDCPMGFAADMRTAGRCNGEPRWSPPDEEEPAPAPAEERTPMADPITLPPADGTPVSRAQRGIIATEAVARHHGDRRAAAAELGVTTQVLGLAIHHAAPRTPKNAPCSKTVPVPPELLHTTVEVAEPPRGAPELVIGAPGPDALPAEPPRSQQRLLDALHAASQSAAALEDDLASAAMWAPRLKELRRAARRLRRDIAVAWVDRA